LKNGYKAPGKPWAIPKPVKLADLRNTNFNPSAQNYRTQQTYNGFLTNNDSPQFNPFHYYELDNSQGQKAFKPSLPDPTKQAISHSPTNIATQIITKSPPISALTHKENLFLGGFIDNTFKLNNNRDKNQYSPVYSSFGNQHNYQGPFPDSSQLSSAVVTGKTVLVPTSQRPQIQYKLNSKYIQSSAQTYIANSPTNNVRESSKPVSNKPYVKDEEYDEESDEDQSSENESVEKDEEDSKENFKHDFPDPPYAFTHPSHKYKDVENPFANPNFDFDAYLTKLSGGHYSLSTTQKPKPTENIWKKPLQPVVEITTPSDRNSAIQSSTVNYKGMSSPRPFNGGYQDNLTVRPSDNKYSFLSTPKTNDIVEQWTQRPRNGQYIESQDQQQTLNQNILHTPQQNVGIAVDAAKPKIKPPNFNDDRQLPISYSFSRPILSTIKPNYKNPVNYENDKPHVLGGTPKPYVVITGTGSPIIISSPKQQYLLKPEKNFSIQPHLVATGKPYLLSTVKPHNAYIAYKQSTSKPLTTLANEHLSTLQQYWGSTSPSPQSYFSIQSPNKPNPQLSNLQHILSTNRSLVSSTQSPIIITSRPISSTTKQPPKRRPIPKPSPEMNDYYYDEDEEDEQYYYEPPVKPKYMPSTEVKPQRPPMAQNYKEYDDSYEEEIKKPQHARMPMQFVTRKPDLPIKNYNAVSVVTKGSIKDLNNDINEKQPIPVFVNYVTPTSTVLMRPEISNYEIIHHNHRNRTIHMRKPAHFESGPFTSKPPKYLNQTTLRPYTVRHRLAKPSSFSPPISNNDDRTKTQGRLRHQNIVAQTIHTTPRDSHNQETRYTKTKHDDKTNR
jgi:hypothetical protein